MKSNRLIIILAIIMLFNCIPLGNSYHASTVNNPKDTLEKANEFLKEKFGIKGEYFIDRSANNKELRNEMAVFREKNGDAFEGFPVIVYKTVAEGAKEATKFGNDKREKDSKGEYRAIGFSIYGDPYPNPKFDIDKVNYVRRWIKYPWELPTSGEKGITKYLSSDDPKDTSLTQWLEYKPNTDSSMYSVMNQWIKMNRFRPDYVEQKTGNRAYFMKCLYDELPPGIKSNPEDFIHIVQPPTYNTWGVGIAFYYYGGNNAGRNTKNYYSYYQYFRFMPFAMVEDDLAASFTSKLPTSSSEGNKVTVKVNVESTFTKEIKNVPFKWTISGASSPSYGGDAKPIAQGEGQIDKISAEGKCNLTASFEMPDTPVTIKFEVNSNGKKPSEKRLENNVITHKINLEKPIQPQSTKEKFDLDYDVLSRKVSFPLSNEDIVAQLTLPSGATWKGAASGALTVTNKATDLLRNFTVKNNPTVTENSARIVRKPNINTTLQRTDFGDNPLKGNFLNWTPPSTPKTRSGNITYNGKVNRTYTYTYNCGKEENCKGHVGEGVASANFDSGTNQVTVRAFIYNGKETVPAKTYANKIDNNTNTSLLKKLFWTSEPYKFDVIRWMHHVDENDKAYDETAVNGQYKRTFTQQNTADIEWKIVNSMAKDYKQSRDAARKRNSKQSEYDKAVFATDIDFKNVDYPIKSGYYFNPTGEYTFEVETVTYKTKKDDTKEHKDLVNSVINAFRYESDLIYINSNKQAVNLRNEPVPKSGNSFGRKSAALTAQNPKGVDGAVLLNVLDRNDSSSRYTKKVEELPHSQSPSGNTHQYFKNILEGYSESGTLDSKNNYKYREYIKDGQHMYKITETTKVTIQINPNNRKVYTHAHMPDGKYTVKVWFENINLTEGNNEYKKLKTLNGISALDKIEVSVKGSMYDDLN